jgi:transposase
MKTHPEIQLVSRGRGGEYATGAREGAPQAIQCADRFHLLKNLGEALEGLLAHHLALQRKCQTQALVGEFAPVWQSKRATRSSPTIEIVYIRLYLEQRKQGLRGWPPPAKPARKEEQEALIATKEGERMSTKSLQWTSKTLANGKKVLLYSDTQQVAKTE